MNNGICYVIGAGTDYGLDFCPDKGDFVIAADGDFPVWKSGAFWRTLS